eukprot:1200247-Prorocentrum_lima.AAC.1
MTSSLVGSEMCIRDRSSLGGASPTGFSRPHAGLSATGQLLPSYAANSRAVSYTHLTLPTICSV